MTDEPGAGICRVSVWILALFAAACGAEAPPRIVVVSEHPLAWPVWEEARAAGELRPGAVLLHLDAHEDLGLPTPEAEIVKAGDLEAIRRLAERELDVDDVVVPALLTGTVSELVWVVPPWLDEAPRDHLREVGADRREFRTRVVPLASLPDLDGDVVLDIDLDFFACENPHAGHGDRAIDEETYARHLAESEVRFEGEARDGDEVTESIVLARPPRDYSCRRRLDRVRNVETGAERFVLGYMCMGLYAERFPVHRPAEAEVRALARQVAEALDASGIRPAVITVARSDTAGFVPADRADAIAAEVLRALRARR